MFNISQVDLKDPDKTPEEKLALIQNPWFINAHRKLI